MRERQCTKCNKFLPETRQYFSALAGNGSFRYWCRKCSNQHTSNRYHRLRGKFYNPEVSREAISAWIQTYKKAIVK